MQAADVIGNLMRKSSFIHIVFLFLITQNLFGQTIDKSFYGCYDETSFDFKFMKNGKFTLNTHSHSSEVSSNKGKYKIINDTINIYSGIKKSGGLINEKYFIQDDTIIVDLKLGLGFEMKEGENITIKVCPLTYPRIIPINSEKVEIVEELLNRALNTLEIKQFYNFKEFPERKPLIINYYKLKADIEIDGKKAIFISKSETNENNYIEFEDFFVFEDSIHFWVILNGKDTKIPFFYGKENNEWKYFKYISE